ncbi:MAG TPA: hypothetical protein VII56_06005 [Rhizomicrobium sp.]
MNLEDDNDIKPRPEIWEKAVIGFAALLTLCGVGVCFFSFTITPAKPPAAQTEMSLQPGEVMIGIGKGQTIGPIPPINIPQPAPSRPAPAGGHP